MVYSWKLMFVKHKLSLYRYMRDITKNFRIVNIFGTPNSKFILFC